MLVLKKMVSIFVRGIVVKIVVMWMIGLGGWSIIGIDRSGLSGRSIFEVGIGEMVRRGIGGVVMSGLEEKGKIDCVLGGMMRSG